MVLSGTIYEKIKESLDKYLFGFDKNQLNVSLLQGAINLKQVNIKPNKAEKLLLQLNLPLALKAGTIGHLELKMSLVSSLWSSSGPQNLVVNLEQVFFIIGPSMRMTSKDDSYLEETEQELLQPYDQNNAFNIYNNNLKLRKKQLKSQLSTTSSDSRKVKQKSVDSQSISKENKDILRGLTLKIKKLHVRYEDDYFCEESQPYSCGLVIDEITLETTEIKKFFERLGDLRPKNVQVQDFERGKKITNAVLKDLKASGARVYWNCLSEMYIPTSLWESTRSLKYQIFEAMDASQLNELMAQAFQSNEQDFYQHVVEKLDISCQVHNYDDQEKSQSTSTSQINQASLTASQIKLNANPQVLNDLKHLIDRCQTHYLLRDLKQYRPHRRPITEIPKHLEKRLSLRKKRRLIVRDWFFFVVWYIRLMKILKGMYQKDVMNKYLFFDPKYANILSKVMNQELTLDEVKEQIKTEQSKYKLHSSPMRAEYEFRVESFTMNIYKEHLFEVNQENIPEIDVTASRLALVYKTGIVETEGIEQESQGETLSIRAQTESFEVNTYSQVGKREVDKFNDKTRKPKELSKMMIKQDVLVARVNNPNAARGQPPQAPPSRNVLINASRPGSNQKPGAICSIQSALGRTRTQTQTYNHETQPCCITPNESSRLFIHQQSKNVDRQVSLLDTSDYISPIDGRKVAILKHDNNHNLKHNLPNMTSPGRLMGQNDSTTPYETGIVDTMASFSTAQIQTPYEQQNNILKRSASKDSLIGTVIDGMRNFLGRQTIETENFFDTGNHSQQVYEEVKQATKITNRAGQNPPRININISQKANRIRVNTPAIGKTNVNSLSQQNFIRAEIANPNRSKRRTQATNSGHLNEIDLAQQRSAQLAQRDQIDRELDLMLSMNPPSKPVYKVDFMNIAKNAPVTSQAFDNDEFDLSVLQGSARQSAGSDLVDNTDDSDKRQERRAYRENQNKKSVNRNNMNDGIKNKNINLLIPKSPQINQSVRGLRNQGTILHQSQKIQNQSGISSQRTMTPLPKNQNNQSNVLGKLLRTRSGVKSNASTAKQSFQGQTPPVNQQTAQHNYSQSFAYANTPLSVNELAGSQTMQQQSHMPDTKSNFLPCSLVQKTHYLKERLFIFEQASDKVTQQSSGKYVFQLSYETKTQSRLAKKIKGDLKFGSAQVTYSNNALRKVSDVLIRFKEFPSFRDFNFMIGQSCNPVELQNSMDFQQSIVEKQVYRMIWRHIEQGFIVRPNRRNSELNRTNMQEKEYNSKVDFFNNLFKESEIDFKVEGDRTYISFFEEKTRDHFSKFISPPISLNLYQSGSSGEAGFEIFGFQYQQSTDVGLLANFSGSFIQQISMFSNNENIKRGTIFYSEMLEKVKQKKENQRRITTLALAKRAGSQARSPIGMNVSGYGSERTTIQVDRVGPMLGSAKRAQKPETSLSRQAIQPKSGKNKPNMLQHAKTLVDVSKNPQSMVGSQLKLEEMPSKQFVGYNSEDDDIVMSERDNSASLVQHNESGKIGERKKSMLRCSKLRQKERNNDDFDDMISSHEESQNDEYIPPNRDSMHASALHQHNKNVQQPSYQDPLENTERLNFEDIRMSQQMQASHQASQAFVKMNELSQIRKNAVYHTDSQGGEACEKEDAVIAHIPLDENVYQSNVTKKMYMEDDENYDSQQMMQAQQLIKQQTRDVTGDQDEPLPLGNGDSSFENFGQQLILSPQFQKQDLHQNPIRLQSQNSIPSLHEKQKWRSTRETQNYNLKSSNKKPKKSIKLVNPTAIEVQRESEKLFKARQSNELTNYYSQNTGNSALCENMTPVTNENTSPFKKRFSSQKSLQMQAQQSSENQPTYQGHNKLQPDNGEIKSLLFMAGKKFQVERDQEQN